jgi:hypothetical protein
MTELEDVNTRPHSFESKPLEEEITVYEFYSGNELQFKTTSPKKFEKFLEKEFTELPPREDYHKINGVEIKRKKFTEEN